MSYFICPFFHAGVQFTSDVGAPLANGNVYTYQAGTTNAYPTWTSNTGSTNNPNPISLDSNGRLTQEIWLQYGQPYKFVVTDSSNVQVGTTLDNISGVNDTSESFSQVTVINSVSSSDTANAASANAVKWAYTTANTANNTAQGVAANTAAAYAAANSAANTVEILNNGTVIVASQKLGVNSTPLINLTASASGSVNATLNASSVTVAANGHSNGAGGLITQWVYVTCSDGGEQGPFSVNFPLAFPTACLWMSASANGEGQAVVRSFSSTGFTWGTIYESGAMYPTGSVSFLAIGH